MDDLKFALSEKNQLLPSMSQSYEKKISDLTTQLKDVKGQLEVERKKAERPPEGLKQLQTEMSTIKVHIKVQVHVLRQ